MSITEVTKRKKEKKNHKTPTQTTQLNKQKKPQITKTKSPPKKTHNPLKLKIMYIDFYIHKQQRVLSITLQLRVVKLPKDIHLIKDSLYVKLAFTCITTSRGLQIWIHFVLMLSSDTGRKIRISSNSLLWKRGNT